MQKSVNKMLAAKLAISAVLITTAITLMVIHHNYWPLYILGGLWALLLLKYREAFLIRAGMIATMLYLITLYAWVLILMAVHLPTGEILSSIQSWAAKPHQLVWYLLSAKGEFSNFKDAAQIRSTWTIHQLWYMPLIFGVFKLNAYFLNPHEADNEDLQGSAKFENPEESELTSKKENKGGFLLGWEKNRLQRDVILPPGEVNEHTIIVGAPGAGKSAGIFLPNILKMTQDQTANMVITDPKMELLAIAGPELVKQGYEVHVFHPYAPELSSGWNMLAQAKEWEEIDDMALSIIQNSRNKDSGESEQWDQQVNQLLDMICYDLRLKLGERANMSHIQAMAASTTPTNLEKTLRNSSNRKIKLNAQGFFSRIKENPKIVGNIMSNMPRMFKSWTIDQVRATTSTNEIDFTELCSNKKVALFVVTPMDKREQLKPLFATFFQQLFKKVQEQGRLQGKLPRPLWFLLDEMGNLGQIPSFDSFLTVVRGYRVGITMGIQSLSQIEEIYGREAAETILNSCANYIFSPRLGKRDAEYFSEMMGDTTVYSTNLMRNRNFIYTELHYRVNEQRVQRKLQTPDEIRTRSKDEDLFVIAGNRNPMKVTPPFYFRDRRWKELSEIGLDENWQKERLKMFMREEPLVAPDEEDMMEEAAYITSALADESSKENTEDETPEEDYNQDQGTGQDKNTGTNESNGPGGIITRTSTTAPNGNTTETDTENNNENTEEGNSIETEQETSNNEEASSDPTTHVEVEKVAKKVPKGNPFRKN